MNNVFRDSVVSVVRQVIVGLLGGALTWAGAHGIGAQAELIVGVIVVFIVNVGWTVGSHLLRKWKINEALLMMPNATNAELAEKVASVPLIQRLQEATSIPEREAPGAPLATPPPATS